MGNFGRKKKGKPPHKQRASSGCRAGESLSHAEIADYAANSDMIELDVELLASWERVSLWFCDLLMVELHVSSSSALSVVGAALRAFGYCLFPHHRCMPGLFCQSIQQG